ncbi:uncharacterized protein CLUP02_12473 [Colletotrichum lupini]|uniref:Uncharacterized protein n=1 Tax=Colletotrichum lupini TaxID=145971 RepID=A0A9Q8T0J2_9PEZI|nr:uncharacterized protein CLUP02_12473 [Colletotrichum lupini]UQC86971.1 hypothetical protein CLUP02_12473 [Colletotrichum lupini]
MFEIPPSESSPPLPLDIGLQVPDPSPGSGSRNGTKRSKRGAGRKEGKDIADGYWTLDSPFLSDYGYGLDRVSEGTMHESTEALWERIADELPLEQSIYAMGVPLWREHSLAMGSRLEPLPPTLTDMPFIGKLLYGLTRAGAGGEAIRGDELSTFSCLSLPQLYDTRLLESQATLLYDCMHKLLLFRRNAAMGPESFEMRSSSEAYSPKVSS